MSDIKVKVEHDPPKIVKLEQLDKDDVEGDLEGERSEGEHPDNEKLNYTSEEWVTYKRIKKLSERKLRHIFTELNEEHESHNRSELREKLLDLFLDDKLKIILI